MIQRIQSIYLGLVLVCGILFLIVPFVNVDSQGINAMSILPLVILTALNAAIACVSIFLFKNRKLQMNVCWMGMVLSSVLTTLSLLQFYNYIPKTAAGKSFSFGIILPFLMIAFFALALSGIKKDDKLVKSMDRLR